MNAKTILSAKGQVVIPKDVRDALGLKPGQQLEVVQAGGGVLLRPQASPKSGRSTEQILAAIRERMARYERPPLSVDEMNAVIGEGWRKAAVKRN